VKKILAAILAVLSFTLIAEPALAINVVQPTGYYASDFASVLSGEAKNHIEVNAKALDNATGAQIVFVTLRTVQPYTTEDYANALFGSWKIGDAQKNNGILVLLAISDQDYYTLEGTGLERNLPPSDLSAMWNEYLEPDFAKGSYSAGAVKYFDALFERLVKIYGVNLTLDTTSQAPYYGSGSSAPNAGNSSNNAYDRSNAYGNTSRGGDDFFSFGNILIAIGIVVVVLSIFGGTRGGCGCLPGLFGGWLGGMMFGGRRRPPGPGPWGGGGFGGPFGGGPFGGGGFGGGGGRSRGSGGGRSGGGFGGFGGGGFGGGGFGGGGLGGGGGGSRGAGGGRGR
jgi:uncharacterized protein